MIASVAAALRSHRGMKDTFGMELIVLEVRRLRWAEKIQKAKERNCRARGGDEGNVIYTVQRRKNRHTHSKVQWKMVSVPGKTFQAMA